MIGKFRSWRFFAPGPTFLQPIVPIPRVLASDPELKKLREEQIRETEQEHREASRDYLAGDYWREFPAGTFRPPIIEPYRPKGRYWSGYV
ncbi:MAG: hypothetical protein R6V85_20210 [Polyangia bacterium]